MGKSSNRKRERRLYLGGKDVAQVVSGLRYLESPSFFTGIPVAKVISRSTDGPAKDNTHEIIEAASLERRAPQASGLASANLITNHRGITHIDLGPVNGDPPR